MQRLGTMSADASSVLARRPATVAAIDARLMAWGDAARAAVPRRCEALITAALGAHGQLSGARMRPTPAPVPAPEGLLAADIASLLPLAEWALPPAMIRARRLLWVDPERLEQVLREQLAPSCREAGQRIRKIQSRHRRRARLWAQDPARLNALREEVEALRLPKVPPTATLQRALAARLGLTPARAPLLTWLSMARLDRPARPRAVAGVLIGAQPAGVGAGAALG